MYPFKVIMGLIFETCRNFLNRGKKNSPPLTSKQWKDAFDAETGCLLNGHKILQRVRRGVCISFFLFKTSSCGCDFASYTSFIYAGRGSQHSL
jgi:hypothetical protein